MTDMPNIVNLAKLQLIEPTTMLIYLNGICSLGFKPNGGLYHWHDVAAQ